MPRWAGALAGGVIFLGVLLAYLPALNAGLIWDDAGHVTRADLQPWSGLYRIWFEIGATQQYYPILHSAFWLEHRLWGDAVFGYHLLNVLLHATNACLFGFFLRRLGLTAGWLAALLFALHPVAVESVAWITEQKNTLSAFFYLLAALGYLRFEGRRTRRSYGWATFWFITALLTKTVTATLPAALLVMQWWRNGRLEGRRDVLPLLPWFAGSVAMGLLTARFEHELIGAKGSDFGLSLVERCLLAGRVVWFYLGKLIWPTHLSFIYPRWTMNAAEVGQWSFLLAALGVLGFLIYWQRRNRGPLAVALIFAGTLFPVLGFINVFPFLYSFVADHFQYLASLPILALIAVGLERVSRRCDRLVRVIGALLVVGTLGGLTYLQARIYRDIFTLYEATLRENPACWMAHNNLAIALAETGRMEEAIPHLETTLKLKSDFAPAENNWGDDLLRLGRDREAIPHFERALQLQPNYAVAHRNLGMALATGGRTDEAMAHFKQALLIEPAYADAELNWAIGLLLTNRFSEAQIHFKHAIELDPQSSHARTMYGRALQHERRFDAAIAEYRTALELDPESGEAHANLAFALKQTGHFAEAAQHDAEAARLSQGR